MMSSQLSSNDLTPCYARDQSPLCALEGPRNKDYLLAPNLRKIALLTIAHEHILPKTASTETLSSDW